LQRLVISHASHLGINSMAVRLTLRVLYDNIDGSIPGLFSTNWRRSSRVVIWPWFGESPVILLDFSLGETASPERSAGDAEGAGISLAEIHGK